MFRAMNGALEMEGFKATFSDLYNVSKVCDLSSSTSIAVNSSDAGCGSSNGAGSDSVIVSKSEVPSKYWILLYLAITYTVRSQLSDTVNYRTPSLNFL